jgi:hypothetical protein
VRDLARIYTVALVALTCVAGSGGAQGVPRIAIDLPHNDPPAQTATPGTSAAIAGPAIRAIDVLNDGQTRDLLRNGFPARLHFRMEIWHNGFPFSTLEGSEEWNVIVRFDPLQKRYRAARLREDTVTVIGDFDQYPALAAALAAPYSVPLIPKRRGNEYFYNAGLDVEMLSLSDLDEVERWLNGELGPAVQGKRDAGGVIGRGIRLFFVRLLGAERVHYQARSRSFKAG